jgi:hypothetical protein
VKPIRSVVGVPLFVLVLLGVQAVAVSAESAAVRLRITPKAVTGGEQVAIAAAVSPDGVTCRGAVEPTTGKAVSLRAKRAKAGQARWTVRTKASQAGVWVVSVDCGEAGSARGSFRVRRPPPVIPANVVVEKAGIASRLSSTGSWLAGYGIVLRNVSIYEDALSVSVTVNILDSGGRILKTEVDTYTAIPAGRIYYAGGESILEGGQPARLEIGTQIGLRLTKFFRVLPVVRNVRVSDGFLGAEVAGEVTNPYAWPLSNRARITYACFDSAGNVIGGGYTYLQMELPPGGRIGFRTFVEELSADQIASVQVSVEPKIVGSEYAGNAG